MFSFFEWIFGIMVSVSIKFHSFFLFSTKNLYACETKSLDLVSIIPPTLRILMLKFYAQKLFKMKLGVWKIESLKSHTYIFWRNVVLNWFDQPSMSPNSFEELYHIDMFFCVWRACRTVSWNNYFQSNIFLRYKNIFKIVLFSFSLRTYYIFVK